MSGEALLAVRDLEVAYKRTTVALQGISLEVRRGQIAAIMGSNGAGKTTVLRAISGFLGIDSARVTRGSIRFRGQALENQPPHKIAPLGIGIVPEREKVFPNLTVADNLASVVTRGVGAAERRDREAQIFEYFPRLATLRRREAGLLSGGERQMLAVSAALLARPELLLIDELSQGLAPLIVQELAERLTQIRRDFAMTMLVVEQSAALALKIADYGFILENGRLALEGSAAELTGNERVQELYLGGKSDARRSYRDARARRERLGHGGA